MRVSVSALPSYCQQGKRKRTVFLSLINFQFRVRCRSWALASWCCCWCRWLLWSLFGRRRQLRLLDPRGWLAWWCRMVDWRRRRMMNSRRDSRRDHRSYHTWCISALSSCTWNGGRPIFSTHCSSGRRWTWRFRSNNKHASAPPTSGWFCDGRNNNKGICIS